VTNVDGIATGVPRRTAVACGVVLAGAAAGCARYGGRAAPPTDAPPAVGNTGVVLGEASAVPVGGGTVFKEQKVVVTQPAKGEFKGFSAVCTHQGCVVAEVADGTINCGCHGSKFGVEDGAVKAGPATKPLPAQEVSVAADGKLTTGPAQNAPQTTPQTTEPQTETSAAAAAPPPGLASTADIPVGGGKVFEADGVVVTQPKTGEFKAFSAVCTHQGCTVATITGGTINCPCHGSKFKVADGSVAKGPASKPLPPRTVTVTGDQISVS
jgi:Rieske Fe-S protein